VINGGVINYFGSNSKLGDGEYLVAESDESDGSFVELPTLIGAVTNIEPEHLEFYDHDFEKQKKYFEKYVAQIPEDGICMMCVDDKETAVLYEKLKSPKLISYSTKKEADIRAQNIRLDATGSWFDVCYRGEKIIKDFHLSSYGLHNVSNALVAVGIADFLNLDVNDIKKALNNFNGVKRRFTKVGEVDKVVIIDDYGHHPTEIAATLKAARQLVSSHKIISVFQAHKYTRVQDLFNEFCNAFDDADIVIVSDIYSAGQKPIDGISQDLLIAGISKNHKNVVKLNHENDLPKLIKELARPGDLVLCTGAGTVTNWANNLPGELMKLI